MCWWCGNPDCEEGEKCRYARTRNPLLNSDTFRGAVRRIERATDQKVAFAPGAAWDGRRPAFVPGIRDAVMRGPGGAGGQACALCGKAISGTRGHADHKTPWADYTAQSAKAAMREHQRKWTGGTIPDDFARVMSSDPSNLQPAHASCNESKSNSMPGRPAGAAQRERREAEKREKARREAERQKRILQQQRERDERAEWRNNRRRGPDRDPGGTGIIA